MSIFGGLKKIVETDCELAEHSWYGLGGKVDFFIRPKSVEQLREVVEICNANEIQKYVLGFGSNLLVPDDGVRGAVIKLEGAEFSKVEFDGCDVLAGAGADLGELVRQCARQGLSGLEGLTGIPGSIGGAVRMNAGGQFGDIGSVVEEVELMDTAGEVFTKAKPELMFDYRSVNITAKFILGAKLSLEEAEPEQILQTIKEAWMYKKNNQPLNTKSAGCIFKNPRGSSAGALIDRANLKGLQIGGAKVSEKHANFIIAETGCKSSDVVRLIEAVRQRVKEAFDIKLELEIEIW